MNSDYERDRDSPDTLGGQWFKLVKDNAECGCRYGDEGLWATLMYQWTGDRSYVDLAWKRLTAISLTRPVARRPGTTYGNTASTSLCSSTGSGRHLTT